MAFYWSSSDRHQRDSEECPVTQIGVRYVWRYGGVAIGGPTDREDKTTLIARSAALNGQYNGGWMEAISSK